MTYEALSDKTLALFFTTGVSMKLWHELGMIEREVAIYNELSKYFKHIYFLTYGREEDLGFRNYLADNITVVPKKYISNNLLYSFVLPFIHYRILRKVDILKTNQMLGSWSTVLTKLIYRRKMVARTGYVLSINVMKANPKSRRRWLTKAIERIAYKLADGIITTSQTNFEYVNRNYHPAGIHVLIPNYVETNRFKPMPTTKKKNSVCFIGRLSEEKNLFALLEALRGLPYTISLIGSGEQGEELKELAIKNGINASFLGNIPNHELPRILNEYELFVLPSLWEGMPKTLLEAMACGLPVIGTNIDGTREVITDGKDGILCDTDSHSIRQAITTAMENRELREGLGNKARETVEKRFSLETLVEREIALYARLLA